MALVNPNIAMSFRQPEFQPRNALAEYAQVQQIVGGQRQAEMADMQMEELRRERDALGRIQAAIVAKGGPPDLGAAADEMIRTGRPQFVNQGMAIRESLKKQRYFEEFESRFGAGRAAPSAAAAAGANAMAAPAGELVAAPMLSPTGTVRGIAPAGAPGAASRAVFNQDAIAGIDPEAQKSISLILDDAAQLRAKADEFRGSVRASGFLSQAEQLENQAASMLAVQKRRASESRFDIGAPATAEQVNAALEALAVGQTPPAAANALAPAAAAPVTNAMLAPAAQPAVPPAGINQLASAGAGPNIDDLMARYDLAAKAGHPMAPAILKQIEAALRGDQNRPMAVSRGQVVIDPRTGQQIFSAPETATLSDRFVPVGRLVFDRQTQQYISPTQAQLAQSQERATAATPAARAPLGYRFTPTGDLEPIPGGPAARGAEGAGAAQPRPLTAAQEVARRDKLGKEFKSATAALQTTQDVLDSISFVKSEPGLSRATGFTGMLPSFPEGAAASAETRLANLKGKITALGKAAAASTGAIGSIANQEWKILADQIAAIDPVKGEGPLLDQLALVETQAQGAMARIQDAYQRQFGEDFERFPQFSNLPAPKSSFTPRAPAGGARGAAPPATGVDTNNPLLR
jgi:hypothetical protein